MFTCVHKLGKESHKRSSAAATYQQSLVTSAWYDTIFMEMEKTFILVALVLLLKDLGALLS